MGWFNKFIAESNRIEGINRAPSQREIEAHELILSLEHIEIDHLKQFVSMVAPRNVLRDQEGLDVYVGDHVPLKGGLEVVTTLRAILNQINNKDNPFHTHRLYEDLHPFTDGNGRSGRALWLWSMLRTNQISRVMQLGFLHNWYYQSLQEFHDGRISVTAPL